jgi:hypothetical protein
VTHRASPPSWKAEEAAGVYLSDEVEATFTVTARDGRLLLKRPDDAEAQPLTVADDGSFRLRNLGIRFVRDTGGTIDSLLVDAGRVRGIRFSRVK